MYITEGSCRWRRHGHGQHKAGDGPCHGYPRSAEVCTDVIECDRDKRHQRAERSHGQHHAEQQKALVAAVVRERLRWSQGLNGVTLTNPSALLAMSLDKPGPYAHKRSPLEQGQIANVMGSVHSRMPRDQLSCNYPCTGVSDSWPAWRPVSVWLMGVAGV